MSFLQDILNKQILGKFNFLGLLLLISLPFPMKAQILEQQYVREIEQYRENKIQGMLKSPGFPLEKKDFEGLNYFEVEPAFNILAEIQILENEPEFEMLTYAGTTATYQRFALALFLVEGEAVQLALYRNVNLSKDPQYENHLFLPMKDLTSGELTYGGGRYLDLSQKDIQDGKLWIDFNKLYNPYCAYSDGYRCPIPPDENQIEISILAGEKNYLGPVKDRKSF